MFEVNRVGEDRVQLVISGEFDSLDMSSMLDALVLSSAGMASARLLLDIEEFHFPSWGALKVELARFDQVHGLLGQFSRVAVLSDEGWITMLHSLESQVMPGMAIQGFRRDQRHKAEAWLQQNGGGQDSTGIQQVPIEGFSRHPSSAADRRPS